MNSKMINPLFLISIATLMLFSTQIDAENLCKDSGVKLQVLGSGGPELSDGRASSSYIVWHQGKARILVDAGPGSSVLFDKAQADFADLEAILLTHLHVDHSADIPAYIKGAYFSSRNRPLVVYGPDKNRFMPSTSQYLDRLFGAQGAFPYLSNFLAGNRGADFKLSAIDVPLVRDEIYHYELTDDVNIGAVFTHHGPVASVAWQVDIAECRITFSGDMSNQYDVLADFAKGSDVLVMNHAVPESARGVARNLHMPPSVIGEVAGKAKVKTVVLSHFMRRTMGQVENAVAIIEKQFNGDIEIAVDQLMIDVN
jgi:ribonuclease BN (tRNA processing enzyme)